MMNRLWLAALTVLLAISVVGLADAASVSGNPSADGWTSGGNSLSNGVYVRESGNYAFDTYSSVLTVSTGDMLNISDGTFSWLAGDTVIGVGGVFANITASEAGWGAFTGGAVNGLLSEATKFVAKFGTSGATFSPSTVAPGAGNGVGSTSAAGSGGVFMRSTGWFYAADWLAHSGTLMDLDKPEHISRNGAAVPAYQCGRLIWNWNAASQHVDSWQMLLNTSLLNRLQPGLPTPGAGNYCIVAVQQREGAYTDARVQLPVPEPAGVLALLSGIGMLGAGMIRRRK